jgi:hypothetical protein
MKGDATMAKRNRGGRGLWSKADVSMLKRLFPTTATAKVAKRLGRKADAVKKKASRMGLGKSRQYLKALGRA